MLEVALTTLFVAVAVVALGHRRERPALEGRGEVMRFTSGEAAFDLPCPWCKAQTSEQDHHCPDCGQRFG